VYLEAHRARDDSWLGRVFARGSLAGRCKPGREAAAFNPATISHRANKAWGRAGLEPVTLHDCRHTFASLAIAGMAARGVFNPKLLQQTLGHTSLSVTYDRYGHLFPGQEAEIAGAVDDLLENEERAARVQRQPRRGDS
jgi:integrase